MCPDRQDPRPEPSWPVVVIGGPTASGKSGLAVRLAQDLDGVVINADSMQVYAELDILTARPGPEETAGTPHRLYGIVSAADPMSAARWRALALAEIAKAHADGRIPIVVGGTGLYIEALMRGLADIPAVPPDIRAAAIDRHRRLGGPAFHAALALRDPETAARLKPGDTQRLVRAWEVLEATGRSISHWQAAQRMPPPADLLFLPVVVEPPRAHLYASCDARFRTMVARGALDEVRRLDALKLDPGLPAMKALGVLELRAHLSGEIALDEAVARAQQATRRYAKRQTTWFRHRLGAAPQLDPMGDPDQVAQFSESLGRKIFSIIRNLG